MIKVSVMYKNGNTVKFDTDYYKNNHLPMVIEALGDDLKEVELDLGIGNGAPDQPAPYVAIAHLKFNDIASFQKAFGPHAATFAADVKNYSNVDGELQINELVTF
ncbi:EthD family reductase [Cellulophaga baltica]|uniref:EthD family reductase n=1 Tax=Cellulophaga TaxID=104264 RepID=UPI001C066A9A|nr:MULTISPECIES: EthD family reductase [Cellulophaga]MBU2998179.1 EthD family reductase [Cellulophaga baltica]MDO6769585.1 EthD family reductase [Cellulophaga sp. 1_MG-2023]